MKVFHTVVIILLVPLCIGCVSSAPKGDTGFGAAKDLQALAGCYRNLGEGEGQQYLSAVIWPEEKLDHARIKAIHVVFEKPRTLRVIAMGAKQTIKESVFIEGKDFHLASGRIKAKEDTMTSFAYPTGNVFIGIGHESQTLGLDEHGNARMLENTSFAGTAFLVIPVAGNDQEAFRFPRSPELCDLGWKNEDQILN